jgi:hypothetical protein
MPARARRYMGSAVMSSSPGRPGRRPAASCRPSCRRSWSCRAVRAQQAHHLAGADLEVHVVHDHPPRRTTWSARAPRGRPRALTSGRSCCERMIVWCGPAPARPPGPSRRPRGTSASAPRPPGRGPAARPCRRQHHRLVRGRVGALRARALRAPCTTSTGSPAFRLSSFCRRPRARARLGAARRDVALLDRDVALVDHLALRLLVDHLRGPASTAAGGRSFDVERGCRDEITLPPPPACGLRPASCRRSSAARTSSPPMRRSAPSQ